MRVLLVSYHDGELEAQRRAGVSDLASRVGRIIRPTIPPAAAQFLAERSFVVAATVAGDGRVHASALAGTARALDDTTIVLHPLSGHVAVVREDVAATGVIGLLAIDFATKRRMRVNGRAESRGDEIVVSTDEVYSNCPQYIDDHAAPIDLAFTRTERTTSLSERQQRTIAAAKTFFIASAHPERGADASHRGGPPGFVHAESDRISWADFPGNNMFNTIGNLLVNPRCGLLFVDVAAGTALQIEGVASVQWEGERRIDLAIEACEESSVLLSS
jgi:predicted pyridoxine 5'-phosphate oxidase superfamily flavin-nucleotide-binding protein